MFKKREDFFNELDRELKSNNISFDNDWWIDHLCYRTSSLEEYNKLKEQFSTQHYFLVESQVGGRMICSFRLKTPVKYKNFEIPLIELPAPKENKDTLSGYEHIEIVCKNSFEDLRKRFSNLNLDTKALSKQINPELVIQFEKIAIKFHHQSLEDIINFELEQEDK